MLSVVVVGVSHNNNSSSDCNSKTETDCRKKSLPLFSLLPLKNNRETTHA